MINIMIINNYLKYIPDSVNGSNALASFILYISSSI